MSKPNTNHKLLIIITGPPAAGKTTIAEKLSEKFPKTVHLSKDFIYHLVESGHFNPWDPSPEAKKQFLLNDRVILYIIKTYLNAGYIVIIEGVFGDKHFNEYKRLFKFIKAFTLLPSLNIIQARDKKRSPEKRISHRLKPLHEAYSTSASKNFVVIDNSYQSIVQTTDLIFSQLHENSH